MVKGMKMGKLPKVSHYMQDLDEEWNGKPPNGLVLIAFIKDTLLIWQRNWKAGYWW
jgi:hypothetical protein